MSSKTLLVLMFVLAFTNTFGLAPAHTAAQELDEQFSTHCADLESIVPQGATLEVLACVEREGEGGTSESEEGGKDWALQVQRRTLDPGASVPPEWIIEGARELLYVESGDLTIFHLIDAREETYSQGEQVFLIHSAPAEDAYGESVYAIRNDGDTQLAVLRFRWSPPGAAADGGFDAFPSIGDSDTENLAIMIVRGSFLPSGHSVNFIARMTVEPSTDLEALTYPGPVLHIVEQGTLQVQVNAINADTPGDAYAMNADTAIVSGESASLDSGGYLIMPSLTSYHLQNSSTEDASMLMVGLVAVES